VTDTSRKKSAWRHFSQGKINAWVTDTSALIIFLDVAMNSLNMSLFPRFNITSIAALLSSTIIINHQATQERLTPLCGLNMSRVPGGLVSTLPQSGGRGCPVMRRVSKVFMYDVSKL
jgi:hypothetical protein